MMDKVRDKIVKILLHDKLDDLSQIKIYYKF